eukprot:3437243-Rhodomonas_salina.1
MAYGGTRDPFAQSETIKIILQVRLSATRNSIAKQVLLAPPSNPQLETVSPGLQTVNPER